MVFCLFGGIVKQEEVEWHTRQFAKNYRSVSFSHGAILGLEIFLAQVNAFCSITRPRMLGKCLSNFMIGFNLSK